MRLFVDATAAGTGGLGTYAEGLLRAWTTEFPGDELQVAVGADSPLLGSLVGTGVEMVRLGAGPRQPAGRLMQQSVVLGRMAKCWRAEIYLALLPQVPLSLGMPIIAFVYDLWHEVRPDNFGRSRRLQRKLIYGYAYRRAAALVALSDRTLGDIADFHPELRAKTKTVLPGCDHVDTWQPAPIPAHPGHVVAFGHHRNKRPDLALDAWLDLRSAGADVPGLVICGLDGGQVAALGQRAGQAGAGPAVVLRAYVPANEFHQLLAGARAMVFTSEFEGFGLPVLEAMRLGVPVAICPDPGLLEAAGGCAEVAEAWRPAAVAQAVQRALGRNGAQKEQARRHALGFTWNRTAVKVRAMGEAALDRAP